MVALTEQQAQKFGESVNRLVANVETVVKGKRGAVQLAVTCLLSEGHLLIEDMPGTGKTTLAKAIAESIAGSWKRIQFTPDLLPSDVTGAQIFNQATGAFEFHPGAIFANVVLADEINRASPKTQSALLEVMEEQQHTVDGDPYEVPRPFVVIATQNPIEHDGTYRLPEAQLDRFLMRTSIGYLDLDSEVQVLAASNGSGRAIDSIQPVMSASQVADLVALAAHVQVEPVVYSYIVQLAAATRSLPELRLGVSTRGALALLKAARVKAASEGRFYVVPEDVKALISPVFSHRMVLSPEAEVNKVSVDQLLERLVATIGVPALRV